MGPMWCSSSFRALLFLSVGLYCFSFVQTHALCREEEHSALLQFKVSFKLDTSASLDPFAYPKVATWAKEGDHGRTNCCSWDGVECDDSGYVIGLDLSSSCLYGSINSNSSLFQLVHLQKLDLSDNYFSSSEIPSRIGHDLTSLTYLNLSKSSFSGQAPAEISKLSKLSTLDLSVKFGMTENFDLLLDKATLKSLVQNATNLKQLHLSWVEIFSNFPDSLLNASSLVSLRLEGCKLYGNFPIGILQLPKLQVLDLYHNENLTGYFPDFNRSRPWIKELNVAFTNFTGQLPDSIGYLHSLEFLDISFCNFYPHFPSSIANLTQLYYLEISFFFGHSYTHFDDPRNQFGVQYLNSDPWSWIAKLTRLYHLGLGYTYLRGELPCFLANLTQISEIDLSYNQIAGQIPSCLVKWNHLTQLNLRFNKFQGPVPRTIFQLKNLEFLDLGSNNLSGSVEMEDLFNLKYLKVLRLSFNKLSVRLKVGASVTVPQFQSLALGSCNLTEFPEFLKNNSKLKELDLSGNQIQGHIPNWMWNSTRESLWYLNFSHNSLTGFEDSSVTNIPWQKIMFLDMGYNMLQGSFPIPPKSIRFYSVSDNNLTGEISTLFCSFSELIVLDLANNRLSGGLPDCLGNSGFFRILKLQNNSFQGQIPQMCSNGSKVFKLIDLSFNRLSGMLPRSMRNCSQLEFLNLGNNRITDTFQSWLGELPVLRVLILRFNGFHGIIGKPSTDQDFPKLCIIDLSNNGFSSWLPSEYFENFNCMKKYVDEEDEQTYVRDSLIVASFGIYHYDYSMTILGKGVELKYLKTPNRLKSMDLSSNRFGGGIPSNTGNLRGLHLLNLSNNTLNGLIPSSLGNLSALESLDLSQNQLSGTIPSSLMQLNFLAYFNVSHNHFSGHILQGNQFDTFQADSYEGNSGLCGKPLSKKCEDSEPSTPTPSDSEEDDEDSRGFGLELDWYVVLPGVVSGLVVGVVAGTLGATKKHEWIVNTFSRRRRQARGTR